MNTRIQWFVDQRHADPRPELKLYAERFDHWLCAKEGLAWREAIVLAVATAERSGARTQVRNGAGSIVAIVDPERALTSTACLA